MHSSYNNTQTELNKNCLTEVKWDNEVFYRISGVHAMRPFFMSIVSDSNHWLFVASNGGISSGRKNTEFSLFPYYTDDKIIDTAEITGSKTILRVNQNGKTVLWEPFSIRSEAGFKIIRNLYQNRFGNKILFEEINYDLELHFLYEWNTSDQYGFIKKAKLLNVSGKAIQVEVLDGLQNILPYGVPSDLQTKTSNLADAYKRSELITETGLGIYTLSAIIADKAEPSEALKANIAWQSGLEKPVYLLSALQLQNFRQGIGLIQEDDIKGEKGAYFVAGSVMLETGEEKKWMIVANVNQTQAAIVQLNENIKNDAGIRKKVEHDIEAGTENLIKLAAASDALQSTADDLKDTRHFSNVLFNIMRGGIFDNNYQIEKRDFEKYLQKANKKVFEDAATHINSLPGIFSLVELKSIAHQSGNSNFVRLATEYLPLKFSRRHGDPSRPWNQFSINTKSETDGSKILDYQGNWRDIFQNWEALAHSYPAFIEGMIYKFLNASTFDGYNAYRITKDGFDWETIEPDNPWSYIGYWGDHQVIYLLKFLEFAERHQSGTIENILGKNVFVYANVPYRIKPYNEIVKNPKDTIVFDHSSEKQIHQRINEMGADGALLTDKNDEIYHVNFAEKILATVLSKLSNFVPEGGIWMNTQRPEWNDANNALVGNGLSMVTLYYLRRFLKFIQPIFQNTKEQSFAVSAELHLFFTELAQGFEKHSSVLSSLIDHYARKQITDALGLAGSNYRNEIYARKFSGEKRALSVKQFSVFVDLSLQFIEHSIRANKRNDGLYHAYNLLSCDDNRVKKITYLNEMLEGQVAVLSSGCLSADESLLLLDALKQSPLYRKDQQSYTLYPNKLLPGFLEKNNIPGRSFGSSNLLTRLMDDGNTAIAEKDVRGNYHFNGNFKNADDLLKALNELGDNYRALVEKETSLVLEIFEAVFNHKEFTGRSGTFYGYEGLGSIYWHMVSKLLLSVQETCTRAIKENADPEITGRLVAHYYEINEGIGVHKSPELYGAFPITPYSHTPFNKGAQQPGMTGQVKEDILCRIGELGVHVQNGKLVFQPVLLRRQEFSGEGKGIDFIDVFSQKQKISLQKDSLFFTYCQVPVIYCLNDEEGMEIERRNGSKEMHNNVHMNETDTASVLNRTGSIKQIRVFLNESRLRM
ncbi:MAG TPA: hypothetical protein PKC54_00055 [Ferruginibacter sp.]|nr:hypothetical protein [Ferruginibacter sp.]